MKRSEVNATLKWAHELLKKYNVNLPEFGYWTLEDWQANKDKIGTISKTMLGWDITDYGQGKFKEFGTTLFTLRNGDLNDVTIGTPYAEKLLPLYEGQTLPCHFHYKKTEDIIVRSGGAMGIQLYNANDDYSVDEKNDVRVFRDGVEHFVKAGEKTVIMPGQSITLTPFMYHRFWAETGFGDVVIGEVSSVNDDNIDNHFIDKIGRFSEIEEDEAILHPLCNEYDRVVK